MDTANRFKSWVKDKRDARKSTKWKFFLAAAILIVACGYMVVPYKRWLDSSQ